MKNKKANAKSLKNIHELKLLKQQLKYQEKLLERDIVNSSEAIFDNFNNSLRNLSYRFGFQLVSRVFKGFQKRRKKRKAE